MSERKEPLVSVLVPTYNHVGSIARCLDSILEQQTDFDFEVLVADDASTDGTSDIVREYAKKDSRITPIIREHNLGVPSNTILVAKNIKTEFLITVEGDDFWCDSKKLQLQVDALRRHPGCSCCAHATDVRNESGDHLYYIERKIGKDEKEFDIYHAPWCHISSILYRNFLTSFTETQWKYFGGDLLYLMYALDQGNMIYLNRVMSVYNVNNNGMWSGMRENEKHRFSQLLCYRVDHFLNFKYTKMFQHKYLPGEPKTLFTLTIPFFKGRKFMLKLQKSKPWKAKEES